MNTGNEAATFGIRISIEYGNEWHEGSFWPTDSIEAGKTGTVWPWPIEVNSDMPSGSYYVKASLFDNDGSMLDEKIMQNAFEVVKDE